MNRRHGPRGPRLPEFIAFHGRALQADEVRHGLILNALLQVGGASLSDFSYWTLGKPGECAIKISNHSIVLGAVDEDQCRILAEVTARIDYPGVIGPDLTARWFTDRAQELRLKFLEPELQQIYAIRDRPRYPGSPGHARPATIEDATLLADWLLAFRREAVPHDPIPSREQQDKPASDERFLFWIVDGQPVSMAGIVRRLKTSAAITGVYTPPKLRGRGYAGSVTAATVERIYGEGRNIACLYADLRNPASNRCYTKIGFTPVCGSLHFHKVGAVESPAAGRRNE
jgi:RimJ/RimL family protein N-acetyltransferase